MSFLLDTCVLSESTKDKRNPGVKAWIDSTAPEMIFLSVVSLGEVWFGIERLPDGAKRKRLIHWFDELFDATPPQQMLSFDAQAALLWGQLRVPDPNCGYADSQIAATALTHNLTLVTRNVKDFAFPGLAVFNPWSKGR